ncbi:MAG: hypothetical protein EA369_03410 [Bradymonadales bacterium]|nr:MAG: hypothetical protein EA369_03410 [Bradymonadales bacterium]
MFSSKLVAVFVAPPSRSAVSFILCVAQFMLVSEGPAMADGGAASNPVILQILDESRDSELILGRFDSGDLFLFFPQTKDTFYLEYLPPDYAYRVSAVESIVDFLNTRPYQRVPIFWFDGLSGLFSDVLRDLRSTLKTGDGVLRQFNFEDELLPRADSVGREIATKKTKWKEFLWYHLRRDIPTLLGMLTGVFGPFLFFHHLSQVTGQGSARIPWQPFSTIHYITVFGGSFVLVYLSNNSRKAGFELEGFDQPVSLSVFLLVAYSIPPAAYIACGSLLSSLSSGQLYLP